MDGVSKFANSDRLITDFNSGTLAPVIGMLFSDETIDVDIIYAINEFYKLVNRESKQFEIIFVSWDKDVAGFDQSFRYMPWLAFPFEHEIIYEINEEFNVQSVPVFKILKGNAIMVQDAYAELFISDTQEKQLKLFETWRKEVEKVGETN